MNNILQGNVNDKLNEIESDSIQCVVTSPPYWGLRDYQTAEWEGEDEKCEHRVGRFEYKVSGKQKSNNGSAGHQAKNKCPKCGAIRKDDQLGLEETPEEYVENMVKVFREVKRVLKDDGTVWLNLGDSYASNQSDGDRVSKYSPKQKTNAGKLGGGQRVPEGLKTKDLVGIPWRVALALQADGWYLRQDIIWHKPNPMPESVRDRCTKSHEYIFLLSKSAKYFYDAESIREPIILNNNGSIRSPKFGKDRPKNPREMNEVIYDEIKGANKRSVWSIKTKPYKDAHFAVFPPKLPELCIKAGSSEGDVVLDPFFGSGTTGWVAQRLGRKWIGIELNPEYIKIAEKRFIQRELFTTT